ncbi:MAG: hypothetical protein AVDCRST_MAG93-5631 [uncultured Chloroflexia bacterium]|uniref:Uncharacterized protein n=1 Tax=uncultured Chloroflexia bacterium TaxID=1672391 RepID=A0A6J4KYV3_9CHLR|nr:MAG: hypothetical protein AVDCRST_MAG93-5631 [uncultured Chloroflexia bacterium]
MAPSQPSWPDLLSMLCSKIHFSRTCCELPKNRCRSSVCAGSSMTGVHMPFLLAD